MRAGMRIKPPPMPRMPGEPAGEEADGDAARRWQVSWASLKVIIGGS